jgi:hypothetical protein
VRLEALSEPRVRGSSAAAILRSLARAARTARDAPALIRLHERLMFLLAYPPSASVRRRVERLLEEFPARVEKLEEEGADLSPFDEPEVAGIAGTTVTTEFSFAVACWLGSRFPRRVGIDWDAADAPDRLGASLPRFVPLLEEEALADANVPYRAWLDAARNGTPDLSWLLARFGSLADWRSAAEIFDALALPIEWRFGRSRWSRTFLRRPARKPFLHPRPLLARRDVSFEAELAADALRTRRLSVREGGKMLDLARAATASRYREFYGFTHGDPSSAIAARVGRGVEIFLFGVLPERRLPLRAAHTAIVLKNGVPVAYYEGLSFFERMEAGFNVYYSFREGESAWIYAKVLRLCRDALGVSSFSVDPYQIGRENEEAIASGAFWFYRKLGFRPTDPAAARLVAREEERLRRDPARRTPAQTLRHIASRNLLYEIGAPPGDGPGEWDRFHIRNLGLAVQGSMARDFGGSAGAIRRESAARVARALGASLPSGSETARRAFEDWSLVLARIPDLARWTTDEKGAVAAIVAAKSGRTEAAYLRRMRRHRRLREALIRLGSRPIRA